MLLLSFALFATAAPESDAPKPVAMVLEVKGAATYHQAQEKSRKLLAMDLLYPEDRIGVGASGCVKVFFTADNHLEEVSAKRTVTVNKDGCSPKASIERLALPGTLGKQAAGDGIKNLMQMQLRGRAAVLSASSNHVTIEVRDEANRVKPDATKEVVKRELPRAPFDPRTPLQSSVVLADRVTFSWEPVADATEYEVAVFASPAKPKGSPYARRDAESDSKPSRPGPIWKQVVKGTRITYPARAPALEPGKEYGWIAFPLRPKTPRSTVSDPEPEWFRVFDATTSQEVRSLVKAAEQTDDPSLLLLLGARLADLEASDEAKPLFLRLAEEFKMANANDVLNYYDIRRAVFKLPTDN